MFSETYSRYSNLILIIGLLLLIGSAALHGGNPHPVYGIVRGSKGYIPADKDFYFEAYVTTRPEEKLYKTSTGCSYDENTGTWIVQCGNFSTPWSVGEELRIIFMDTGVGSGSDYSENNYVQGQITNEVVDNFGETSISLNMINSVDKTETVDLIPTEFGLSQNYPNPFNPSTTIAYSLPVKCHVKLTVYDMTGRTVATLRDEVQTAGTYKQLWVAKNSSGNPLASGRYFYRIQTDSYVKTFKMTFVR